MPVTNFLQWNSGEANQETDAEYLADAQRVGGAPIGSVFPSATANKLFFQISTMVLVIANFITGQGYNAEDSNLSTLLSNFIGALASLFSAPGINSVPFSATPTFNAANGTKFEITLTGNVTSSNITGLVPSMELTFIIHQDSTGGRSFVWPSNVPGASFGSVGPNQVYTQKFVVGAAGNVYAITPMMQLQA
jgi:hypothetical protein